MNVAGDLVEAVVPFMGESITDGTLATFLKSMLLELLCDALTPSFFPFLLCLCGVLYSIHVFNCYETRAYDTFAEPGDKVAIDEPIAQIETDKVFLFLFLFFGWTMKYFLCILYNSQI